MRDWRWEPLKELKTSGPTWGFGKAMVPNPQQGLSGLKQAQPEGREEGQSAAYKKQAERDTVDTRARTAGGQLRRQTQEPLQKRVTAPVGWEVARNGKLKCTEGGQAHRQTPRTILTL